LLLTKANLAGDLEVRAWTDETTDRPREEVVAKQLLMVNPT
jgi:hypothetical protein